MIIPTQPDNIERSIVIGMVHFGRITTAYLTGFTSQLTSTQSNPGMRTGVILLLFIFTQFVISFPMQSSVSIFTIATVSLCVSLSWILTTRTNPWHLSPLDNCELFTNSSERNSDKRVRAGGRA